MTNEQRISLIAHGFEEHPSINKTKFDKHKEVTEKLFCMYEAKDKDYGSSFSATYKKLGIISAVTRMTDKMNRLENLATQPQEEQQVKGESIMDTLMDLANYAIMTVIELEDGVE